MKKYRLLQWYPSLPEGVKEGFEVTNNEGEGLSYYSHHIGEPDHMFTKAEVENNNFWKEVEYNILSFFDESTCIASVERVSDGEVFSVKDTLSHGGRIKEIVKDEDFYRGIRLVHDFGATSLGGAIKKKQFSVTTSDGVNIFDEGVEVHWVREDRYLYSTKISTLHVELLNSGEGGYKVFSTKEAAMGYLKSLPKTIDKDQKIFSYNDIVKLYNDTNNNFEKINHFFARVLRAMEKQLSDEI